jgi:hypothetical protein
MGVQHVDWESEYFKLEVNYADHDGTQHFVFEPITDLTNWTKYSNTYLGEVTLISKEIYTTLCVILLSENPYVLTLINPTTCDIKVQPHQILEFIFWGTHADAAAQSRSITSGHLGLTYKEQGNEEIAPSHCLTDITVETGDFIVHPRNTEQYEWHYWYRLPDELICTANGLPNAIYHGGKINFGSDLKRSIDISLSVKKREPKKPREQQIIIVPGTCGYPTSQTKLPKLTKQNYQYVQKQWHEPTVAEVNIHYKGNESLTNGCYVIDLGELKGYIKEEQSKERELYRPAHYIYDYD